MCYFTGLELVPSYFLNTYYWACIIIIHTTFLHLSLYHSFVSGRGEPALTARTSLLTNILCASVVMQRVSYRYVNQLDFREWCPWGKRWRQCRMSWAHCSAAERRAIFTGVFPTPPLKDWVGFPLGVSMTPVRPVLSFDLSLLVVPDRPVWNIWKLRFESLCLFLVCRIWSEEARSRLI